MNFKRRCTRRAAWAGLLALVMGVPLPAFEPTEDGLYAVFTTSLGECAVSLLYEEVPLTVANFVGLAEGTQAWLDLVSGEIRRDPFYDGLTFHRVADLDPRVLEESFIIQGGSRNGRGTDDPGYSFPDEILTSLAFDEIGLLAMANSGPNSNGSQFFFNLGPTTHLNGVHTIFGRVVSGMNVLEAITEVERDTANRPVEPVVMEQVEILRVGAGAEAFDIHAWQLPQVLPVESNWRDATTVLEYPRRSDAFYFFYGSLDLSDWSELRFVDIGTGPSALDLGTIVAANEALFVRPTEVVVPMPQSQPEKTLTLDLDGGSIELVLEMVDGGAGVYSFHFVLGNDDIQFSAELVYYAWVDVGNNVQIIASYQPTVVGEIRRGLADTQIHLEFETPTSGKALVRFLSSNPANSIGTFTFLDTGGL